MTVSKLFLKACVCDTKEDFYQYFLLIESLDNLNQLDGQGSRLVPYYISKLNEYKLTSKHQKRFDILKKFFWLKSIFLQNELIKVCKNLSKHNIQPFIFKGMSVFNYYNNFTYRPTLDLDILVPYDKIKTCLDVLKKEDYIFSKNYYFLLKYLPKSNYNYGGHAMFLYHKKNKVELDLHYNINHLISEETQKLFLLKAEEHPNIKNAKIPKLEHEVYLSIMHGVLSNTHINWIMDVVMIKQVEKEINWNEILLIAKNDQKTGVLIEGLKTLETYGVVFDDKRIKSIISTNIISNIQIIKNKINRPKKENSFFLQKHLIVKERLVLRYGNNITYLKEVGLYIRIFTFLFFLKYFLGKDIARVVNKKRQLVN